MLYPANIGAYLSIDEVSLSNGELYTFVTNKAGKGEKGSLVASIKGTRSQDIIATLERLPVELRGKVREVTLDMAKNIESAVSIVFSKASLVTDRFHVVRLAMEALQHLRIKKRWEELDKENKLILTCKSEGKRYKPKEFSNGDTPKQLLARSRYIIAKKEVQWTENQRARAHILFKEHPDLYVAYKHSLAFRSIYEERLRRTAELRFRVWIKDTFEKELEPFYTTANTVNTNFENILNFFTNRNTNANAESL
ncbi:MAG: transposase [Balneolaceae bacterium]